jgi:hypothetical protein
MFNDEEIYQASVKWQLTIDDIRYILTLYEYDYFKIKSIDEDYPNIDLVLKEWFVFKSNQGKNQSRSLKGALKTTKEQSEYLANRLSEEMKTSKDYEELVERLFNIINQLKSELDKNGIYIDDHEILKDFPDDLFDRYRCS